MQRAKESLDDSRPSSSPERSPPAECLAVVNPGSASRPCTGRLPLGTCTPQSVPAPTSPSETRSLLSRLPTLIPLGSLQPLLKRPFQIQFLPRQPRALVADINQNLLLLLWSECGNTAFCALIIIQQMLLTDTVITTVSMYLYLQLAKLSSSNFKLNARARRELRGYLPQWMHFIGNKQSPGRTKSPVQCHRRELGAEITLQTQPPWSQDRSFPL